MFYNSKRKNTNRCHLFQIISDLAKQLSSFPISHLYIFDPITGGLETALKPFVGRLLLTTAPVQITGLPNVAFEDRLDALLIGQIFAHFEMG